MSDQAEGEGWWRASDDKWYPPELHPHAGLDEKERRKAEKADAAEWRRAQKATERDAKNAEKAQLNAETAGTEMGFRFFKDGTVRKERFGVPDPSKPRSRVLEVTFSDNRQRKSFLGRGTAAVFTAGLSLAASNQAGTATLTLSTEDWVETITKKEPADVDRLAKVNGLALSAKAAAGRLAPTETQAPSQVRNDDPVKALRDLKALHDEGILSDEEYEAKRKPLTDRL